MFAVNVNNYISEKIADSVITEFSMSVGGRVDNWDDLRIRLAEVAFDVLSDPDESVEEDVVVQALRAATQEVFAWVNEGIAFLPPMAEA